MGKIRRRFTVEFKQAIVTQILSGEKTASQLAREYQLAPTMIQRWKEQVQTGTLEGASATREHQLAQENRLLKEKVAELYLQVDLLKKVQISGQQLKNGPTCIITASSLGLSKKGAK